MRSSVGGSDEVGHGFGLAEVELAVEVGSLGELSGVGHTAAVLDEEVQDLIDDIGGAVTGDFHGVFAGVAVRGTEDGDEGFIDDFLARFTRFTRRRTCGHGGYEAGDVDGVGCNGVAAYGTEGGDGIEGLRAADADDGKSAPDGCGGGADGINLCSEW